MQQNTKPLKCIDSSIHTDVHNIQDILCLKSRLQNSIYLYCYCCHPVVSDSLWPHGLQHSRPPCPSQPPEICPSSCPLHQFSSVQFSRSVMSDSLRPHEPQHARLPCPSPTPRVYPNSCPLGRLPQRCNLYTVMYIYCDNHKCNLDSPKSIYIRN